ncbi:AAA domain-containing protein [Tropicimonas sp. TH_r6]|uniref:AAA domain-containing protein n=1 Tax=Tropicimonas sp. TH_r6 TaxID=3082085 RepID=UPI002953DE5A|nr:AAA domain-containing protein [Tropicimonas sp. TH_r6]MDV7142020.1 AAA domain-containing protein [Tropicimonas sp. TH_r6]
MSAVLKTVEAFPRGRTTRELIALLDADFSFGRREEIRAELLSLQKQGILTLGKDDKWRVVGRKPSALRKSDSVDDRLAVSEPPDSLAAVPAYFGKERSSSSTPDDAVAGDRHINPNDLLRYYKAALQSDPRGALTQAPDRHTTAFQLVSGAGDPFPADEDVGIVRVQLDHLPDSFREAIARRDANERALAVGWPIEIGRRAGAPTVRPVGLIAATWDYKADFLEIRIENDDVIVNPDWVKAAAQGSPWSNAGLSEVFAGQGGTGLGRDRFSARLREAAARSIRGRITGRSFASKLETSDVGIFDAMGLFFPVGSTFTAGAVRDLDEIAYWEPEKISRTSLGPLLGMSYSGDETERPPINVGPLNHEQIRAVSNANLKALSVVTGPPGTGKSQAIVAMAATTILGGGAVAVASKNHQALDAVEQRLSEIAPNARFLVRTLDPAREIDVNLTTVVSELVSEPSGPAGAADLVLESELSILARQRLAALDNVETTRNLNTELADAIETIEARRAIAEQNLPNNAAVPASGLWGRVLKWLAQLFGFGGSAEGGMETSRLGLERLIKKNRERLKELGSPEDPVKLTEEIESLAKTVLRQTVAHRAGLTEEQRIALSNEYADLSLHEGATMSREIAETVLQHRPLWLASVLGAPKRLPLYEGLFDLVIFDEASQCDIASALPLLARAKRAVVVGDDRQLAFIPQLGAKQDRNLMMANGLPEKGTGRFSQSAKSLFDLARSTPNVPTVMLRDQYRSAEDIVGYINTQFYGGKLRVSANLDGLKVPQGRKPGLAWTDVPGPAVSGHNAQNANEAEVAAICKEVGDLLVTKGYTGSIGVISPFRSQVQALTKGLQTAIPQELWEKSDLRVGTVDGFQGQERDLILFSPTVHRKIRSSAVTFLQRDWRRMNVAISRARAVAHVFSDLGYARSGRIKQLQSLAARATEPRPLTGEGIFDSEWERLVFHALNARGLNPQPQYDIAGRRLDFALFGSSGIKLDLEVDGRRWHQDLDGNRKLDDHWRDHQMRSLGWKVRRFWVDELKQDMEGCLDLVERDLNE